jgi:two-component SAPR family response regulator
MVANINSSIRYWVSVITTRDARHALITLRENEGLFDLVIVEFHIVGMNGLEFQKHVKDQLQIPIISKCHSYKLNQPCNFFLCMYRGFPVLNTCLLCIYTDYLFKDLGN